MLKAVAPPESGDSARRAFYLGGLCHILEMDDLHRDSVTHPGCVVIPAAWAIAEERDLGGRAFLKAVLAGYEACCRVGMAVGKAHYRVWHNTSTCGPFGSAMAGVDLLGLSEDEAVWALGNAGTQSSGLWQFLESGAMSKHLHTARAAESGVLAALLAQRRLHRPGRASSKARRASSPACAPTRFPQAVIAAPGPAVGADAAPRSSPGRAAATPIPPSMRRSRCMRELGGAAIRQGDGRRLSRRARRLRPAGPRRPLQRQVLAAALRRRRAGGRAR